PDRAARRGAVDRLVATGVRRGGKSSRARALASPALAGSSGALARTRRANGRGTAPASGVLRRVRGGGGRRLGGGSGRDVLDPAPPEAAGPSDGRLRDRGPRGRDRGRLLLRSGQARDPGRWKGPDLPRNGT